MLTCLHRSLSIYAHSYLPVLCDDDDNDDDDNDDDDDDDDDDDNLLLQSYKATKQQA